MIFPKYVRGVAIVRFLRGKNDSKDDSNIESLYHMFDHRAEAVEFKISETSAVTGTPLKDLSLKRGLLVASIYREGRILIPGGQDEIRVGDEVMVVTTHTGFHDIRDILA